MSLVDLTIRRRRRRTWVWVHVAAGSVFISLAVASGIGHAPGEQVGGLAFTGALWLLISLIAAGFLSMSADRRPMARPISGPERPAERLLRTPIAWFPVTGERGRYTATASGASLGLRVDSWEVGVRYIISADGRTVREVDALPPEWRLGA
jgi:hypothetical protein